MQRKEYMQQLLGNRGGAGMLSKRTAQGWGDGDNLIAQKRDTRSETLVSLRRGLLSLLWGNKGKRENRKLESRHLGAIPPFGSRPDKGGHNVLETP